VSRRSWISPRSPSTTYRAGINDKLLGQIELVRQGIAHVRDGGSFTLVSGVLSDDPIPTGTVASAVNGALHAFVRAAANELPRGLRINVVSPTAFEESWGGYAPYFRLSVRSRRRTPPGCTSGRCSADRLARCTESGTDRS
jgi:NAD(P)-dependent dehydrogenase (short-subunit alcohol dehydrogenase family)